MKKLLLITILFSLNTFGQDKGFIEAMIQGCLSDSTFEYNLLSDTDYACTDQLTYDFPFKPVKYYRNYKFDLAFNGKNLAQYYYNDSTQCSPFTVSFSQKSKSTYEVLVNYSISLPLSCNHIDGHGTNHGCVKKKVISIHRKLKVKKNGTQKTKKTEYYKRIMTATFL